MLRNEQLESAVTLRGWDVYDMYRVVALGALMILMEQYTACVSKPPSSDDVMTYR